MSDYEQIRALTYEYTFCLDRGDFGGVAELLKDGQLRMAARGMDEEAIRGAAAIEAFYTDQVVTYDGEPRTRHQITNHAIELDAEAGRASGRCYFTVLMAVPRQPIRVVVCGRYSDSFVRAGEGWRLEEKVIEVDYFHEIGDHFKIADAHSS